MNATNWGVQSMLLALVVAGPVNAQMIIVGELPDWMGHGPPPAGWEPRDTADTQYVPAVEGTRIIIPRKADGTCKQASMLPIFKPGGTPDSFDDIMSDMELSIPNDGSCDVVVKKATVRRRPFVGSGLGAGRAPESASGARSSPVPGSITCVGTIRDPERNGIQEGSTAFSHDSVTIPCRTPADYDLNVLPPTPARSR